MTLAPAEAEKNIKTATEQTNKHMAGSYRPFSFIITI